MSAHKDPVDRPAEAFGEAWRRLFAPPIAHRGLWSASGAPENSLAAFQHAVERGYGVELDVQLSADGEAIVFHDAELARLTGTAGRLRDKTARDLRDLALAGTDETIPTLAEALTVIGRQGLVIIELKTPPGEVGALEKRVAEVLIDHAGPAAVASFNPYSVAFFADHHPKVLRGLISYSYADQPRLAADQRRSFQALEHASIARPHFLSLGADILPSGAAAELRQAGKPVIAWTVRSADVWEGLKPACDNYIFEGFAP